MWNTATQPPAGLEHRHPVPYDLLSVSWKINNKFYWLVSSRTISHTTESNTPPCCSTSRPNLLYNFIFFHDTSCLDVEDRLEVRCKRMAAGGPSTCNHVLASGKMGRRPASCSEERRARLGGRGGPTCRLQVEQTPPSRHL